MNKDAVPHTRALPAIQHDDRLDRILLSRRSTKQFTDRPLSLADIAHALWTVAGTTMGGRRVGASARATYPVAATLIAGDIDGLAMGAYLYDPAEHTLAITRSGDQRQAVADASLDAGNWLPACSAAILLSADVAAARERFPDQPADHGERFVWIEVGLAAQNAYLWAAERGVGTVLLAGLDDERAVESCHGLIPDRHELLGILPLGEPVQSAP